MNRRAICATFAGHTHHAISSRTWYQPGRINRAYQRTNLTELSGGFHRAEDSYNQISGETMSEITDLVVIEKKNAMAVFTNNDQLDPLIELIEKEARSLVPDVTTKKGRDAIASMAHKVARSKTYIDNAGKDLVAELKALPDRKSVV